MKPAKLHISRRAAVPDDVPFLLRLRESTMSAQLAKAGVHHSPEDQLARVMHRFECAEIVLESGKPAGLIKVHRGENQWKIVQLQLCPSIQGKGVGSWLIRDVIQQAGEAQAALTLTVFRDNPARRLYQSLGFSITGGDEHEYFMTHVA